MAKMLGNMMRQAQEMQRKMAKIQEELASLGAKCFRIAHRQGERPNSVTTRPRCLIVGEWTRRPPAGAETWRELVEHFGSGLQAVETYAGRRAYPWPDAADRE